ncbi:MAG TPA: hypothetical protein VGU23_05060 [Acidobacteriaceae bacterium]|nr:hypothetical protein [Acidobacteriaceae bacterium]
MSVRWLLVAGTFALLNPSGAGATQGLPTEKEILGLATRQSWAFCHPENLSKGGCELSVVLVKDEWVAIASPKFRIDDGSYLCCAPDHDHFFYFSRTGTFLREDKGGP